MDEAGAGTAGRGGHHPRAVDVRGGHFVLVPPATMDHRRSVDHDPGPIDGGLHPFMVFKRALDRLDRKPGQTAFRGLPRADKRPHRLAAGNEHPHDVVADKPGRPCHEDVDGGRAAVGGRPEGGDGRWIGGGVDHEGSSPKFSVERAARSIHIPHLLHGSSEKKGEDFGDGRWCCR